MGLETQNKRRKISPEKYTSPSSSSSSAMPSTSILSTMTTTNAAAPSPSSGNPTGDKVSSFDNQMSDEVHHVGKQVKKMTEGDDIIISDDDDDGMHHDDDQQPLTAEEEEEEQPDQLGDQSIEESKDKDKDNENKKDDEEEEEKEKRELEKRKQKALRSLQSHSDPPFIIHDNIASQGGEHQSTTSRSRFDPEGEGEGEGGKVPAGSITRRDRGGRGRGRELNQKKSLPNKNCVWQGDQHGYFDQSFIEDPWASFYPSLSLK